MRKQRILEKSRWKTFPKTKKEILKLYSIFGSTYICESSFSFSKLIKTRNGLSENNIENLLRIKCCPYSINIDKVINNTVWICYISLYIFIENF